MRFLFLVKLFSLFSFVFQYDQIDEDDLLGSDTEDNMITIEVEEE